MQLGGDGSIHGGVTIAQDDRSKRLHQVNVAVAVHIHDGAAFAPFGIDGIAAQGELTRTLAVGLGTAGDAGKGALI